MLNERCKALAAAMKRRPRDFTLDEIYRAVCLPPHTDGLTPMQLHRRCSRAIGEIRAAVKKDGYVLTLGELRNSYRVVKRERER